MKVIFDLIGPLDESVLASVNNARETMKNLCVKKTAVRQKATDRILWVQQTPTGTITVKELYYNYLQRKE